MPALILSATRSSTPVLTLSPHARRFHAELTAVSGLKRTIRAIEGQDEYITRFSALAIAKEDRRIEAPKEHHELVNLVEKRDLEGFERLMRKHIERSKENCLKALEESGLRQNG